MKKRNWIYQHLFLLTTCILVVSLLLPGCGRGGVVVEEEEAVVVEEEEAVVEEEEEAVVEEEEEEGPIFRLQELYADVDWPEHAPEQNKVFHFSYLTNQEEVRLKITAPDGSSNGPIELSGPGEKTGWARIPPQDYGAGPDPEWHFSDLSPTYIALPGAYNFTVYDESGTTEIREQSFLFDGAKLVVDDARVTKWNWQWSWPVCLFYTKEFTITVSNQGDLPSCASVLLQVDDKETKVFTLGLVEAGESRTFKLSKWSWMIQVNFNKLGDLIPPTTHSLSVRLVSDLPNPNYTEGFPEESRQYYSSPECPYPIVIYEYGVNNELKDRLLLLDDYSTTIETPAVQTG